MSSYSIKNFGPVASAELDLGDLNIFVGPQATGKSTTLQLIKLLIDQKYILEQMKGLNLDWGNSTDDFFEVYFGEGMAALKRQGTLVQEGAKKIELRNLHKITAGPKPSPKMFYIPAQRVMSLNDGITHPFSDFQAGDPFVLRDFSDTLHALVQGEFRDEALFPPTKKRLHPGLVYLISEHIFGKGLNLNMKTVRSHKRLALSLPSNAKAGSDNGGLPYVVWSAGQREFVPMLLGLYWLMPFNQRARRNALEWVVIEEPEMGLHPNAMRAVLALVLQLLYRGYKVCLSTHSTYVLDLVWALRIIREHHGKARDVLKILGLADPPEHRAWNIAREALTKQTRVYYFERDAAVQDISSLDPGHEDKNVSGWGGLTQFSGDVSDVVGDVLRKYHRE